MPTAAELAKEVGGMLIGDGAAEVRGFAALEAATPSDIVFATGEKYRAQARGLEVAVLVSEAELAGARARAQIVIANPNLAFARIVDRMVRQKARRNPFVDSRAWVAASAYVDPSATIMAGVAIDEGARIGARTVLYPGVYIGPDATLGEECIIHPNVVIMDRVFLGNRVVVHGGAVIGADGFGYATSPEGEHVKIPQTGTVVLEDDVEVGACTCIDRARFDVTRIGAGTKIDNLVQIAHNVVIGPHSMIVSQVGIAGSTKLGHHVVLAGHVGVAGHLTIGDGAQVSALSGVGSDLEGGQAYMGVPARPIREGKLIRVLQNRLPEIYDRLKTLERDVEAMKLRGAEGGSERPA